MAKKLSEVADKIVETDVLVVGCGGAAARAALTRTESRGVHYRADYPNIDFDNWTKNIVVKQVAGEMKLRVEPIVKTIVEPPKGIIPWAEYTEMESYVEITLKKMKETKLTLKG